MTAIGFYHLTRFSLDQALPKLLLKVQAAGLRAVIQAGSAERMAHLDAMLWTFAPDSWLPHGTTAQPMPDQQPILIAVAAENLNQASVLILADGAPPDSLEGYERCLVLFDGHDPEKVAAARGFWRRWTTEGYGLSYYQQSEAGGWELKHQTVAQAPPATD